ncbi:methyltransferase domain-containing protein [Crocinitomicaceae bacterium]|nr:methyltransferase domain-containing protein [Crocinitomicaceae bacterium]
MQNKEWFAEWFDTPYYHILYKNRDNHEARVFIKSLVDLLQLPEASSVLDLACGKGRHSITLNEFGYKVLGVDLSTQSIAHANQFSNSSLSFAVQDMREPIQSKKFDAVFNLFTSFGYFSSKHENEKVCQAMAQMLNSGGKLVIDFMNAQKVIQNLVPSELKKVQDIEFDIKRIYSGTHIIKQISFQDKGQEFEFQEQVQAIDLSMFKELLAPYFTIDSVFGSFELNEYIASESDRLIIIATRK